MAWLIRPFKGLIRPFKGLIRPFKGLIRPFKSLIRPLKGLIGGWRHDSSIVSPERECRDGYVIRTLLRAIPPWGSDHCKITVFGCFSLVFLGFPLVFL